MFLCVYTGLLMCVEVLAEARCQMSGFGVTGVCDPPAREAVPELRSLANAILATEIHLEHLL